jgi:large subunit ribosomal protein L5
MAKGKDTKPKKGAAHGGDDDAPTGPAMPPRLREAYKSAIAAELLKEFPELANVMQTPKITSIVINVNMGRHLEGAKLPANVRATVIDTITKITGQKPIVIKAKKSVSNFKLRAGYESSAMVTLRRDRMWHFLDRFINLATPRIKDFRGLKDTAFDKRGNYSCGITEQGVFPEINMAEVTFTHGMNININIANSNAKLSKALLTKLGMPFRKPEAA